MEFFETIKKRRSVRAYKPDAVEGEKLAQVLEAARLAPTACNRQAFRVVVIETAKCSPEALARIYGRPYFSQAPLLLAVCAETDACWARGDGVSYGFVDAAIVMDHIILAATALGLGTCWIGAFDSFAARELLALGAGFEPVAFTPLGYADDVPAEKQRRALGELVIHKTVG